MSTPGLHAPPDIPELPAIQTQVYAIDPCHPAKEIIARASEVLKAGGLVAFPTETVYGLGANARDIAAVRRIFAAKERPTADPLIVHVLTICDAMALARRRPAALEWVKGFWPGPLTVVLPKRAEVPDEITAGLDTVAVRVPAHPVARALLEASGVPIAAPSANRFTRPSPTLAAHVLEDLGSRFELLLDGGPTAHGVESTVLDLSGAHPRLLRPGAVTVEALREVLPELEVVHDLGGGKRGPMRSPGTQLKHYAPRARVVLVVGRDPDRVRTRIAGEISKWVKGGQTVGLLRFSTSWPVPEAGQIVVETLSPAGEFEEAARGLFAALRALDAAGVDVIVTSGFEGIGLGHTLQDRLLRAAEGQVLSVDEG